MDAWSLVTETVALHVFHFEEHGSFQTEDFLKLVDRHVCTATSRLVRESHLAAWSASQNSFGIATSEVHPLTLLSCTASGPGGRSGCGDIATLNQARGQR